MTRSSCDVMPSSLRVRATPFILPQRIMPSSTAVMADDATTLGSRETNDQFTEGIPTLSRSQTADSLGMVLNSGSDILFVN